MRSRRSVLLALLLAFLTPLAGCATPAPEEEGDQAGDGAPGGGPERMAALGDSITRAFAAVPSGAFPQDHPDLSWSTGTAAGSHASRLAELFGLPRERVYNNAVSGARMEDLLNQATKAAVQRADYVTILLGANDLCRGRTVDEATAVDDYEGQFRAGVEKLATSLPHAKIFVASIPNVTALREVYAEDPRAQSTWDSLGICPAVLGRDVTASELAAVEARIRAYNDVLARVCSEHAERCRYDGGAVFAETFTAQEVSEQDFFHPSAAGQQALADLIWSRGWWTLPG